MIESGYFRSDAKYQSCEAQRSFFWPRTTISITIPTYGTYIVEIELLDPRYMRPFFISLDILIFP